MWRWVTLGCMVGACGRFGFAPGADDDGLLDEPSDDLPAIDADPAAPDASGGAPDAYQCVPDPAWPVARMFPGVAFDEGRGELVVHGGSDASGFGVAATSTWRYGVGWTAHTPATAGPAVHFSAMAYSVGDARTVLIGGCVDADCGSFADRIDRVWGWDGATWTDLAAATHNNYQSSIAYDRTADVITYRSGWDFNAGGTSGDWNDAWTGVVGGTKYTANQLAFDPVNDRVMFYGGYASSTLQSSTMVRAAGGGDWIGVASATSPGGRANVGITTDLARDEVVMFGGNDGVVNFDDTWIWDGTDWALRAPATRPSPRSEARLVYDPARQVVLLFGGNDAAGVALSDLWQWDGVTWTQLGPC